MNNFRENITQRMNEVAGTDIASIFKTLVEMSKTFGGKVYLVGGAVRDELMGVKPKDYDFLVTKIELPELAKHLSHALPGSKVNEVGQSFGIIKLSLNGEEYDFAIPRADLDRDNVKTDPNIPVEEDLVRRDFTFNSMAKDLETGQIINAPGQNGQEDIKNKVVRATGDPQQRFQEDPLRMLRAIQFATRFSFSIEENTLKAIKRNVDLLNKVSGERFYEEFYKAWTKGSKNTVLFFALLEESGLGRLMFGPEFDPIPVATNQFENAHQGFMAQAIAAFLNGGDFKKLIIKTDEQDIINTAHWFKNAQEKGLNYQNIRMISNFGRYFNFIKQVFKEISTTNHKYNPLYAFTERILSKPLIPKKEADKQEPFELPISGGELMEICNSIGKPIKGKAISETLINLIKAYQEDKIILRPEGNKNFVASYLSTMLTESYIRNNERLDVVTNRIGNIFKQN